MPEVNREHHPLGTHQDPLSRQDEADDHTMLTAERSEMVSEVLATRQLYHKLLENAKATGNLHEDRQRLKQQFIDFAAEHLGWSPCNFSSLPLGERLELAVAFSRIPEAQGTISQTFVGDISYSLAFSSWDAGQSLTDQINNLPVEDQIDAILYLSTLYAIALAQGHEEQAVETIKHILLTLGDEAINNSFLKYAIAQTWNEIEAEEAEPTRGFAIRTGDSSIGRRGGVLSEADAAEMRLFKGKIQPEGNSTNGAYLRVARDAIAIVDHALFPQNISLTHENFEATGESDARYEDAEQLISLIKQSRRTPAVAIPKALFFADQHLLPESTSKSEAWHDIHPDLSSEEWCIFWKIYEDYNAVIRDRDARVHEEQNAAEQRNLEASTEFIKLVSEAAQSLPSSSPYTTLIEGLNTGDSKTQFKCAESLAIIAHYQPDAPDAIRYIAQLAEDVQNFHLQSFDQARKDAEAIFVAQQEYIIPLRDQLKPYFDKFQQTHLLTSLTTHAESLLKADNRIKVEFRGYPEAVPAGQVRVGEHKKTSDISLLLQEIHRPAIRRGLEQDLGVSLRDLTVREQLQLILFLAQADPGTQKRTFLLTQQFGTVAAQAFLSGEYGEKFFKDVLVIGEQQEPEVAQRIFERYSEISTIAQDAVTEIAAASLQGTSAKLDPMLLQMELLNRAKTLLESAAKPAAQEADILKALEAAKAETVLFTSICKAYFKNNLEAKLEDVQGMSSERKLPVEIEKTDQEAMLRIFEHNWKNENPPFFDLLRENFKKKLMSDVDTTEFHIVKKDGKILAYIRFDDRPDLGPDAVYTGSINVNPSMRGSGIGEAMMRATINEKAKQHTQYLHVNPNSIVGTKYVEDFGFIIIGVEASAPNKQDETFLRFLMKRDDNEVKILHALPHQQLQFDTKNGTTDMVKVIDEKLRAGYAATRYFADPQNPHLLTLSFVRVPLASEAEKTPEFAPHRPASTYTQTAPDENLQY